MRAVKPPLFSPGGAAAGAPRRGRLGIWTAISLTVIFGAALFGDVSRFLRPSGEKYMGGYYFEGQMDFSFPYLGARAILAHQNPYLTTQPEFSHPVFAPEHIDGQLFRQLYPPTHLLSYVPLALVFGDDLVAAGRFYFILSLGCLVLVGVVMCLLVRRIRDEPVAPPYGFLAVTYLMLHPGIQLGLERGQSDNVIGAMAWLAIFLFARRWFAAALFLVVWATAIKAYPALLALGLALLAMQFRVWRRAALGAAAAVAVLVLPVAEYLPLGVKASIYRANMFWPMWLNHSFKTLVWHTISEQGSDQGGLLLTVLALVIAMISGWRARQLRQLQRPAAATFAVVLFSTAALVTVICSSHLSVPYNLVLVVPGVVVLAASQDRMVESFGIGRVGRHLLGAALTFCGFAVTIVHVGEFPIAALGDLTLLAIAAGLALVMTPRRLREVAARAPTASAAVA